MLYSILQWCVIKYCNGGLFSTAMVCYSILQWCVIQYCNGGLFSIAMVCYSVLQWCVIQYCNGVLEQLTHISYHNGTLRVSKKCSVQFVKFTAKLSFIVLENNINQTIGALRNFRLRGMFCVLFQKQRFYVLLFSIPHARTHADTNMYARLQTRKQVCCCNVRGTPLRVRQGSL